IGLRPVRPQFAPAGGRCSPDALSPIADDGDALLAGAVTLHEHAKTLLALAEEKLTSLKKADTATLSRIAAVEVQTLEKLLAEERKQGALIVRVAQALRVSTAGKPRLSDVAEKMSEPLRSQITAKIAGLRAVTGKLQQMNRRAADVARHLHSHIREIFSAVAKIGQQQTGYDGRGQHKHSTTQQWVDAVG
ncbi:MAG: flagellar export chaperone FlgN, partial [Phycisphaerae bacterium]